VTGNRVELVVFGKIEKVGVLVRRKNGKKAHVRVVFDNCEFCIGSKSVGEVVAGFKVDVKFGGDLVGAHKYIITTLVFCRLRRTFKPAPRLPLSSRSTAARLATRDSFFIWNRLSAEDVTIRKSLMVFV
jgi:hypothetical protein